MDEYKDEEYIEAIRKSGASPELLGLMLGKFSVLMDVEDKRAALARLQMERAALVDEWSKTFSEKVSPLDDEIRKAQAALAELEKQAALSMAPAVP